MKTKILVGLAIFLSFAFVAGVFGASLVLRELNRAKVNGLAGSSGTSTMERRPATPVNLTATEVAKHNSVNDCWLIINSKVYNVTSFIGTHPGGAEAIIRFCGRDASQAFATKGRSPAEPHSAAARDLLVSFLVGSLAK